MAKLGNERIVGVDVSKDRLDLYDWDTKRPDSIANDGAAIDHWLAGFSLPVRLAIEPTNRFHIEVAERARKPISPTQMREEPKFLGELVEQSLRLETIMHPEG